MSEDKPRFVAAGYHVFDTIDSPVVTVAECLPGGEDGQGWARRVADALNDSIEYSWSGEGPTIAEAGGGEILARDESGALRRAQWAYDGWFDERGDRIPSKAAYWTPVGWRRMPPAHDATRKA